MGQVKLTKRQEEIVRALQEYPDSARLLLYFTLSSDAKYILHHPTKRQRVKNITVDSLFDKKLLCSTHYLVTLSDAGRAWGKGEG